MTGSVIINGVTYQVNFSGSTSAEVLAGSVNVNGVNYPVKISDLTPADVLQVFSVGTSIVKTDSILLQSAGSEQNSAKKVLLPHLISAVSSAVGEDAALTIEPYYDDNGTYQGMYWHYNRDWLRRADTGAMIRVDEPAAAAALSADAANDAAEAANGVVKEWTKSTGYRQQMDTALTTADQDHNRAETDHSRADQDHSTASSDHTTADTDHSRAATDHQTASSDHTRADTDHQTATTDHQTATTDHGRAETDHSTADSDHTRADSDHVEWRGADGTGGLKKQAEDATAGAENVNAEIDGMTVKITDRTGTTRQVDVSLDFYETYSSVAAMNADLANIPKCALVSIATDDPTSAENARVYQKRSDGTMKYLFDLDQASAQAWAEWLNTKKPQIDAALQQADSDHTRAETDHTTAGDDHTQADTDHSRAETDSAYTRGQGDRAKAFSDHPWEIRQDGYIWVWDETHDNGDGTYGAMVKTNKMIISFDDLTEAQRQQMIQDFYDTLVFASVKTCEDIVGELF